MNLRAELDAAYRRIAQLEKELESYRNANSNSTESKESTKMVTRSSATHSKSASLDQRQSSDAICTPATRSRSKAMARRMDLKPSTRALQNEGSSNEMATVMTVRQNGGGNVKGSVTKTIQPTPNMVSTKPIMSNTFVPLNLPTTAFATPGSAASPAQLVAAKMTSVNILSASSNTTEAPPSPTMSTNIKKTISKRHSAPVLQSNISKISSRKERSGGLIAKCTEPRPGQTRYWTEEEHERFLEAVAQYGEKAYVAISNYVETRTPKQVRTHAQKFQMKVARLAKEKCQEGEIMELPAGMLPSSIGIDASKVMYTPPLNATPLQVEAAARAASENEARRRAKREAEQQAIAATLQSESENEEIEQPMLTETISSISDVTNEELSDPYLNYIGGEAVMRDEDVNEFEECFAARLPKSWEVGKDSILDVKSKLPGVGLITATTKDDDLEDLEDCGELSMASLINFGI